MEIKKAPYGSWASPITASLIAQGSITFAGVWLEADGLYWLENRPFSGGRSVLCRSRERGEKEEVTPPPFDARTRVHEYGGGSVTLGKGEVFFSHFPDQRLYRVRPGETPRPLTAEGPFRYADGVLDAERGRLIVIREDHGISDREAQNTVAAVDLSTGEVTVLEEGHDFYAYPRLSPDGSLLSFIAWDHPRMPWDGTFLYVAPILPDGRLGEKRQVAGGLEESIFQPEWSPEGTLYYISDRQGWWNLYRLEGEKGVGLLPMEAEFGEPLWQLGATTYGFAGSDRLVLKYEKDTFSHLAALDLKTGGLTPFHLPFTAIQHVKVREGKAAFVGSSPERPMGVILLDLGTGEWEERQGSMEAPLDEGYLSRPRPITFPSQGGRKTHALYYPPQNKDFQGPEEEKPPLLVFTHGGPTNHVRPSFNLGIQYWTSRGFAVVDVNYGGSTGYGRNYRELLKERWGQVDVEDCQAAAHYLVQEGLVDGERLAIRGGSAGGYTTMAALVFGDTFKAGASHFGVSDLEALAKDTHKFESRYLDGLVGPYPEERNRYLQRSPIHFTDRLSCPMIFFQGLEDKVVPPHQAEMMVEKLREKGIPVAYLAFPGEGHGFRKAENIRRTLEAELYFYGRVFGFTPADELEAVEIKNL